MPNLNELTPANVILAFTAGFAFMVGAMMFTGANRAEAADADQALFERRCSGCHALDRDKEGPRLQGVYGRMAGAVDTFQYSDALKASKIVWTEETLDRWLSDPEKMVPNTDMAFHVEMAMERRQIITFLKRNSPR